MFYELFARLMNMSITASVVIAAVLIVRAFMGKMPKRYSYVLWLIVAFRLLCPVGIASPLSVFNLLGEHEALSTEYWQERVAGSGIGQQDSNIEKQLDDFIFTDKKEGLYPAQEIEFRGESLLEGKIDAEGIRSFVRYGTMVWLSIAAILAIWNFILLFLMRRKVSRAIRFRDNVYECDDIPTPFVMGLVKPKIYIPFRLNEEEREYIIKHEKHHIDRKDNIAKLIAVLITCIYWFHPLVWISYFLMIRDMEMSCDEYVLQKSMRDIREDYSRSLLGFATNQRNIGMGLIAFGESDTRKRVKHVMKFQECGKWLGMVAVGLVIVAGAVCLTDAKKKDVDVTDVIASQAEEKGGEVQDSVYERLSKIYTNDEIESALRTVKDYFSKKFDGCTLTELYYPGDAMADEFRELAARYDVDEGIIIYSSFDVDSSLFHGGDGSLNPNSTYKDFQWFLIRNKDGNWEQVGYGY